MLIFKGLPVHSDRWPYPCLVAVRTHSRDWHELGPGLICRKSIVLLLSPYITILMYIANGSGRVGMKI